ncbi:MAG: glycosyltransferase family 4 protein [Planctomycetales bacterium]|jgi:UDP-GlcNAc:undecaprenyl-phosphate GlcNAc-1-phosphate transferase
MIGLILTTIGLSAVLTVAARLVGIRAGLLDVPDDGRKQHAIPVPALGGIAVFAAFAIACAFNYAFDVEFASSLSASMAMLLGTAAGVWILGIVDDIRPVRAKAKLAVQIIVSVAYVVAVQPIDELHIARGIDVSSSILVGTFCVFWLVACCNAVNLLDGMDGMASLQGMLGFATLAIIATLHGDMATASVCLLLVASVFGFAIFNAPPASIFLGDSGSMTIGYLLGALTLSTCHMANGRYGLAIPLAVMIIPAFDTTVAIVRRAQKGKGIMAPDREHFHHSLFDAGRSVWKVLGVFAVMYGLCAAAAIAGVWANSGLIATLVCVAVLATCVGTKTFGYHELKFLTTRLASRVASLVPTESLSTLLRSSDVLATNQLDSISEQSDEPAVISIAAGVTDAEDDSADETPDYDTGIRRAA